MNNTSTPTNTAGAVGKPQAPAPIVENPLELDIPISTIHTHLEYELEHAHQMHSNAVLMSKKQYTQQLAQIINDYELRIAHIKQKIERIKYLTVFRIIIN